MGPQGHIRTLMTVGLGSILVSELVFVVVAQTWSLEAVLYGLIPAVVLAFVAEILSLRRNAPAVGILGLAAALFAGYYTYLSLVLAHALVIVPLLAGLGTLAIAGAGVLALLVKAPAPARTFATATPRASSPSAVRAPPPRPSNPAQRGPPARQTANVRRP